MGKEDIYNLLSFMMGIGNINNEYNDYLIFDNQKLLSISVSLQMEIDDLLEKGHTEEFIRGLIDQCDFLEKEPELSEKEAMLIKRHAYRLLKIRYQLYMESKEEEKVKKHLFNK